LSILFKTGVLLVDYAGCVDGENQQEQ